MVKAEAQMAWGKAIDFLENVQSIKKDAKDGKAHPWRQDLVRKLVDLQKPTGEWVNDGSGRWQENDPQLVTAYAMIALQVALADE